MFRDLLVLVEGDETGRQRVRFSVDLAERVGARLSGLHVTPSPEISPRHKPSQIEAALAHATAAAAAAARAAREVFEHEAARRLPDACWIEAEGDVLDGVAARARFADLVIVGQDQWQTPPERHALPVAHSIVMRCSGPVLVAPFGAPSVNLNKIAVAWDGSREAVRAVHDAMPLLNLAQTVHLIALIDRSDASVDADIDDLTAHLARHGIAVETKVECVTHLEEHKMLLRRIDEGAYGLLVMGGYSHPMWVEFIFGGATQSTLLSSTIPVLVSH